MHHSQCKGLGWTGILIHTVPGGSAGHWHHYSEGAQPPWSEGPTAVSVGSPQQKYLPTTVTELHTTLWNTGQAQGPCDTLFIIDVLLGSNRLAIECLSLVHKRAIKALNATLSTFHFSLANLIIILL